MFILRVSTLVLISIDGLIGERCSWNQITVVDSGSNTTCVDCPKCMPGYGLSPQCGSHASKKKPIKCVRCRPGVSFSAETSVTSCRPCTQCDPNEKTIRNCTSTKNAICGRCNHGYYREFTGDCHRCTWCCEGATSDHLSKDCLDQGFPKERACRDISSKYCGPPTPEPSKKSTQDRQTTIIYKVPIWMVLITIITFLCLLILVVLLLVYIRLRGRRTRLRKEGCILNGTTAENELASI